jgi:hypothetical protein
MVVTAVVVVVVVMPVVTMMPVPVAPITVMQPVADLAEDVERPFMAMAVPPDDRIGEEIDANPDRDRAAIGLGLRGWASRQCDGERQRRQCG